jgi:hypothetical protein
MYGSITLFHKIAIYFMLFIWASLQPHNPLHGIPFSWLKSVGHLQDKAPVLGYLLKKNLHFILRNLKEGWRRTLMSWTTGMITDKYFLTLQLWQGTFYAFSRHLYPQKICPYCCRHHQYRLNSQWLWWSRKNNFLQKK